MEGVIANQRININNTNAKDIKLISKNFIDKPIITQSIVVEENQNPKKVLIFHLGALGDTMVTCDATDTAGNTATTSIRVNAATTTPHVTLTANIESGIAPFTTYFSISTSIPNTVSTYQMDYEGDGTYDWSSSSTCSTTHIYPSPGNFNAKLRVTDDDGAQNIDTKFVEVN